ncbi:unnamed protein product [Merluccius merluccius]
MALLAPVILQSSVGQSAMMTGPQTCVKTPAPAVSYTEGRVSSSMASKLALYSPFLVWSAYGGSQNPQPKEISLG